ncbi:MAG: hypothetical protein ACREVL_02960 [Solimonas sp.]
MRYYDSVTNEWRVKRRYAWAFWAALAGLPTGMLLGLTLIH